MIKVGDVVARRHKPGVLNPGEPPSAKWMFSTGYFLVLKVHFSDLGPGIGYAQVCFIMNDCGNTSWIDKRHLKVVVELQDEK